MPLIYRINPQQHWSQLQLPILSLTQETLLAFVCFLAIFSVYKKCFWFTLTGKSSAGKVLHISSINNVFYYPTASLHGKGNHCLAPLLIYCTTRLILPIHYQSFKSPLAAALLHFQGGNRFSSDFRGTTALKGSEHIWESFPHFILFLTSLKLPLDHTLPRPEGLSWPEARSISVASSGLAPAAPRPWAQGQSLWLVHKLAVLPQILILWKHWFTK